jgi:urease accessory protein
LDLHEGASVAAWDILSAGRTARGERWAFAHCALGLALRQNGRALLDERWLLDPAHGPVAERLGRFEALATMLLFGPSFLALRTEWGADVEKAPVSTFAEWIESASPVGDAGLLVRVAATSVESLVRRLRSRFAALVPWLGDDPFSRRS